MGETRYYGIRHHGPGSAGALKRALERFRPDRICLEFPEDGQKALKDLRQSGAEPPVALLLFDPNEPENALSLPLAEFSPEWQVLQFAFENELPVKCIDLPAGFEQKSGTAGVARKRAARKDPMKLMAQLAGYEEVEQWWDQTFEQREYEGGLFPQLERLIQSMRAEDEPDEETRLREEWMEALIREEEAAHADKRIAVVCGAWHLPALKEGPGQKPEGEVGKMTARWIPWSYERLSRKSGYGAGILAPHWYECIFKQPHISRYWISSAAQILREKGHMASPAHVIEALQLLEQLKRLRAEHQPALGQLERVIVSSLCRGNENIFHQIKDELYTGSRIGKLPELMQRLPVQIDFEQRLKYFRLGTLPHKSATVKKELDLRKEKHMELSCFLHKLMALDMPLGRPHSVYKQRGGTFTERWELKWKVEYEIELMRAAAWGNTVDEAAENSLLHKARALDAFEPLSDALDLSLKAQLWKPFEALVEKLRTVLADSAAVGAWMQSFPELVRALRYGHVRDYPAGALGMLVEELFYRLASRLHAWLRRLPTEQATGELTRLQNVTLALDSIDDDDQYKQIWLDRITEIPDDLEVDARIRGWSARLLYEHKRITIDRLQQRLERESAYMSDPLATAHWFEGFIYANALTFLRQQRLVDAMDHWLQSLDEEHFRQVLPVMRRALSKLSSAEKKRLWTMIYPVYAGSESGDDGNGKERAIDLPPYIRRLLEF